jgi:hypothetical protein
MKDYTKFQELVGATQALCRETNESMGQQFGVPAQVVEGWWVGDLVPNPRLKLLVEAWCEEKLRNL